MHALIGRTCDTCISRMREISKAGPATMASEGEEVCVLERVILSHYIYKAMWTPSVGEMYKTHTLIKRGSRCAHPGAGRPGAPWPANGTACYQSSLALLFAKAW